MYDLRTTLIERVQIYCRYAASALVLAAMGQVTALGDFFYAGYNSSGITRVDERTGEVIQVFATTSGDGFDDFRGLAMGPDGLLYVSAFDENAARFGRWGVFRFDPSDGTYVDTFIDTGPLDGIAFDSQGDLYAVRSWSGSLIQFDGSSGETLRTVLAGDEFQNGVGSFAVGPGGELFASTDLSKLARYDLDTGERIGPIVDLEQLGLPGYRFDQMAFGPDGKLYATYNYHRRDQVQDGGIMTFDADTGELLGTLVDDLPAFGAANGGALGLAFGPTGDLYVGSRYAEAILRLDSSTFQVSDQLPLSGGTRSATFIAFVPVPEPAMLSALLGLVGGILVWRRRRKSVV